MKERLLDINPEIEINAIQEYVRDKRLDKIIVQEYDYVVDAIDTLAPEIFLINQALKSGHNIISSMGAGGKTDPQKYKSLIFLKHIMIS